MKNLHYLKKFVVMVLAAMMTLSTFALPTFAADNSTATIKGVEYDATVTGYQFVEQDAKTSKWKPSEWVGAKENADKTGFTFKYGDPEVEYTYIYQGGSSNADALDALAYKAKTYSGDKTINTVTFSTTATSGKGDFTGTLNSRGSYLVTAYSNNKVTGKKGITVYKPMVISKALKVGEDGKPYEDAGTIDDVAEVKSSNTGFDKVIKTKPDGGTNTCTTTDSEANNKGDTLKPGDKTTFQIIATAPAYSEDYFVTQGSYTGPTVKITDTLEKLTLAENPNFVVKYEGNVITTGYTLTPAQNGKSFEFVVTDKAMLKAGGDYVIEYDATLDADAYTGFDANTNKATYEYTRKPGIGTDGKPFNNKEDEITYHYTFDIDGKINGQNEGREIIKVGIDNYTGTLVTSEENFGTAQTPLEGATFVLVKKGTDDVVCAAVSAKDGRLKEKKVSDTEYAKVEYKNKQYDAKGLTKLDAGEYDLIEVDAPAPYNPNTTRIPVVITAELYNDTVTKDDGTLLHRKGMLKTYSVKVNNEDTNTYTWKNDGNDAFSTVYKYTTVDEDGNPVEKETTNYDEFVSFATNIVNTNIGTLPSTGGMGTVLFTVAGAAIMALAIFLLFGGKKKQHQK